MQIPVVVRHQKRIKLHDSDDNEVEEEEETEEEPDDWDDNLYKTDSDASQYYCRSNELLTVANFLLITISN